LLLITLSITYLSFVVLVLTSRTLIAVFNVSLAKEIAVSYSL
jgi:hypothetical protein